MVLPGVVGVSVEVHTSVVFGVSVVVPFSVVVIKKKKSSTVSLKMGQWLCPTDKNWIEPKATSTGGHI